MCSFILLTDQNALPESNNGAGPINFMVFESLRKAILLRLRSSFPVSLSMHIIASRNSSTSGISCFSHILRRCVYTDSLSFFPSALYICKGVYDEATGLVKFRNCVWYTNLDFAKRHEKVILWQNYSKELFPKYDEFDAINVDKIANIPVDYDGIMGVPITFLDNHNPDQFEIIWLDGTDVSKWYGSGPLLNGKKKYRRLFIRKKESA